jgi:hypothetical protein
MQCHASTIPPRTPSCQSPSLFTIAPPPRPAMLLIQPYQRHPAPTPKIAPVPRPTPVPTPIINRTPPADPHPPPPLPARPPRLPPPYPHHPPYHHPTPLPHLLPHQTPPLPHPGPPEPKEQPHGFDSGIMACNASASLAMVSDVACRSRSAAGAGFLNRSLNASKHASATSLNGKSYPDELPAAPHHARNHTSSSLICPSRAPASNLIAG